MKCQNLRVGVLICFVILLPTYVAHAKTQQLYKPTAFTAKAKTDGVLLVWNRSKTTVVTGYALYRSEVKSKKGLRIKIAPPDYSYWLDTTVKAGKKYYYTLQTLQGKIASAPVYTNATAVINTVVVAPISEQPPTQTIAPKINILTDIIVDTTFFSMSDSEIRQFVAIANQQFGEKMEAVFELRNIKRINYDALAKGPKAVGATDAMLTSIYGNESFPNYMIVFTKNGFASLYGGYAIRLAAANYCNPFKSVDGQNVVLGGVLDWDHMYARCGYTQDGIQETISSKVSLDGECRGTPNTECVMHPTFGYQMCKDVYDKPTWYAEGRRNMLAANVVHEFLHHFGDHGNDDHFASPTCDQMMGNTSYREAKDFVDIISLGQQNAVICPLIFKNVKAGYVGCTN